MSVTSLKEALENRGVKCAICNEKHNVQGKCKRGDLVFRIENLLKANSLIPQLMNANKEAVSIADGLQAMAGRFDQAHTALMEILKSHGEVGATIEKAYLQRMDEICAPKEPTNLDTSAQEEQLELPLIPELSTQHETETKLFTKQPSGLNSEDASLNTTRSATAVENALQ